MKNGSIFTFGVQMWLAMQLSSFTPNKKQREQVLEMKKSLHKILLFFAGFPLSNVT